MQGEAGASGSDLGIVLEVLMPQESGEMLAGDCCSPKPFDSGPVAIEVNDVISILEVEVERDPKAIALVADSGTLTCSELNQRPNRLARRLLSLDATRDSLVGSAWRDHSIWLRIPAQLVH